MARKGKKVGRDKYEFKYKERFQQLIDEGKKQENKTLAGFKLKNTNQLWRWDTLEDI